MRAIYYRSLILLVGLAAFALLESFAARAPAPGIAPAGSAVGALHRAA